MGGCDKQRALDFISKPKVIIMMMITNGKTDHSCAQIRIAQSYKLYAIGIVSLGINAMVSQLCKLNHCFNVQCTPIDRSNFYEIMPVSLAHF